MIKTSQKLLYAVAITVLVGVLVIVAFYVLTLTVPSVRSALVGTVFDHFLPHFHDEESEHVSDRDSAFQGPALEIVFSPTAAKNIGLDDTAITTVEVIDFYKSLSFPAEVVERPGFSTITVPSLVSGVVTRIYHETGVAVEPGEPLFDILLNQQELVKAQTEFLSLLKRRQINAAEMARLSGLDPQIIPRQRRELEYEKLQIDSEIDIQKNVLLLQGLNELDITDSLEKTGTMIRHITVYAPPFVREDTVASMAHAHDEEDHIFTIDELYVTPGKNVAVGDSLCRLFDYCKLAIKGKVFAVNEQFLARALASKSRVTATFEGEGNREIVEGLFLRSIDNRIDIASGTLFCYVDLQNDFIAYAVDDESPPRRYTKWHFKPGQRCELNIEYEPLLNCIVLPVDAVAKDLQEFYVFEWVGSEEVKRIWRKTSVHAIHQTKDVVVIANDGSVFPGAKIASRGARFILAALDAANMNTDGGGGVQHGDHVH